MNYVVWKLKELKLKGFAIDESDVMLNDESEIFIYEDGVVYAMIELENGDSDLVMIGFANYNDFVDREHPEIPERLNDEW